jgi:hypothetical protein
MRRFMSRRPVLAIVTVLAIAAAYAVPAFDKMVWS